MYKLKTNEVEGTHCINCNVISSTILGKILHNDHKFEFETVIGKCNSVQNFLNFCVYEDLPVNYLLGKGSIKNKKKKNIPNYWGICAYVLYEKIRQHKSLPKLLINSELPFTIFYKKKTESILGNKEAIIYAFSLEKYVQILEDYRTLLKEDKFTHENINAVIRKYSVTDDLFEGTSISLQ